MHRLPLFVCLFLCTLSFAQKAGTTYTDDEGATVPEANATYKTVTTTLSDTAYTVEYFDARSNRKLSTETHNTTTNMDSYVYYEEGTISAKQYYTNALPSGQWTRYENGKPVATLNYDAATAYYTAQVAENAKPATVEPTIAITQPSAGDNNAGKFTAAEFSGGNFISYFSDQLFVNDHLSEALQESGFNNQKIIIRFTIDTKGVPTDIDIRNCLNPEFQIEIMRVILSAPKWKPAYRGTVAVQDSKVIPFTFKFEE